MTTEMKRFTEAYATMTIAAYEPLIVRWISMLGIRFIASEAANRLPKATALKYDGKIPAALALGRTLRQPLPRTVDVRPDRPVVTVPVNVLGRGLTADMVRRVDIRGYPAAVAVGNDVYLTGFPVTDPPTEGNIVARTIGG